MTEGCAVAASEKTSVQESDFFFCSTSHPLIANHLFMVYLTTIKHRCVLYVLLVSYILLLILSTVMALSAVKSSSLGRGLLASNPLLHPRHNNAVHLISLRHIQQSHHIQQCQSSSDIQGTEGIVLTPEEENLFQLLKRVVVEKKLKTTVRVAGGWVRDKLLSVPGKDDVDIALDNMTGLNFVAKMNEWIEEHGMDRVRFGVIQQNPDKSKHLETVAMNYGKISIDFVNLRTESYTTSSRIPLMAIGTPQEDAYRRDLTINALFYNIHSNTVEDFTHMGIQDLKQEMIRTPLEPLITLTDDPLRALRAVRFACRFNFNITSELLEACANEEVHQSLLKKVSKERISAELELMMKTPYFARAMYVLYRTQLWQTVMRVPEVIYTKMPLHAQPSPSSVFSTKKGGQFYDHLSPSSIEYQSFQALFHKISTLAVMSGHLLTALDVTQRSPRLSAVLDDTFTEGKKKMFILSLSSISTTNYFTKVSEERRMCHVSESMLQVRSSL